MSTNLKRLYTGIKMREKRIFVEPEENGLRRITAEMRDKFHHIQIHMWVEDQRLRITKIHLDMRKYPEPKCIECEPNLQKLVGTSLQHPNFRHRLLRTVGGERGCFHVLELLHEAQDYSRAYLWDQRPDEGGHYKISTVSQEGKVRCIAFKKG